MNTEIKTPRRRLPAVEKSISEIKPDKDVRVRILGTLIGLSEESILVDDKSGKVEVFFDDLNLIAGLKEAQLVKVVARILPLIDGFECRGEAVQDLTGLDIGLYRKAQETALG